MPITVTCEECSEIHRVRDDAVGKRLKCKGCGISLKVEAPAPSEDDFANLDVSEPDDDEIDPSRLKPALRKVKSAAGRRKSSKSGTGKSAPVPLSETKVPLGIQLVYYGFMLFLFAMFVTFGIAWTFRNTPRGIPPISAPVLYGLGLLYFASSIVTTVGKLMCVTAPPQMSGKGVILAAVAFDLFAQAITVAKLFMVLPPPLVASINLVSVAGMVCFVWFLQHLGRFLKEQDISERASGLLALGFGIVAMWLAMIVLSALAMARVLPVMVGGLGGVLLSLALLIVGIIGVIRYVGLLHSCLYTMSYES
ncbi:MAG: hypothetical protein DWH91_02825 [Planctomycetota bacterium]|nr:MAG: hypothetical protein DWH91_02825 [Planctomycetota bacterium]